MPDETVAIADLLQAGVDLLVIDRGNLFLVVTFDQEVERAVDGRVGLSYRKSRLPGQGRVARSIPKKPS